MICMSHPGMWDDFFLSGTAGGTDLEISRTEFERIQKKYYGDKPAGMVLHAILEPLSNILGMTDCGGCANRELALSEAVDSLR